MRAGPLRRLACALLATGLLLCACAQPAADVATPEQPAASAMPSPKPKAEAHQTGAHTTATAETAETVPTVLPESADAGRAYLDGTLFIGDSNTARYMMYADETGKAFTSVQNTIGVVSMGAQSITSLKCERFKGDSTAYTIPDAVARLKPQRILIGFGTNNLGGYSAENFIKQYRKGLDAITAAWEYADIIVCAVPPLDYQRENTRLNMQQVDAFNAALTEMCEEDGYHFLDTSEALKDAKSGWAKKDYTLSDGVHLSKTAVSALFGYIRTHALTTADRRPENLGTIPVPDGVPPGLIQQDPIAVRGAKVPVEFVADKGGSISGAAVQNVKKGGTCSTVTAVPNEGWMFDYWSASIGSVGGGASLTFTVPGNADANGVIVTAHFAPAEHAHNYVEIEGTLVKPTCEQDGGGMYECSICGDVIEKTFTRLGHDWDDGVITRQPTAEAEGLKVYTCRRDSSHTRTETIPRLAATPTPPPTPTPSKEPASTPTPTQPPQHVHNYQGTVTQAASCGTPGVMTYSCSCGEGTYTESIPATGEHIYGPEVTVTATCTTGGSRSQTCTVCGYVNVLETWPPNSDAHQWSEPWTDSSNGDTVVSCTVCGAERERIHNDPEPIPQEGDPVPAPQADDPPAEGGPE